MPRIPHRTERRTPGTFLGYAKASTDYRDVLADPDVDVVSICAPTGLHREIGVAAAEAGKPFWIEKPVGRDANEAADVAAAASRNGVVTSVGYNYRHAPAVERVRELVTKVTSAGSPMSAQSSSTAMPPNRRAHCRGGSSATLPASGPSVTC